MQPCVRCGGLLQSDTPRDVIDDKVYHVYCGWKIRRAIEEKKAIRNISAEKGEGHADTLHQGSRSSSGVCDE